MLARRRRMAILARSLTMLLVAGAATAGDETRVIPIYGNEQGVRVWAQVSRAGRTSIRPFVAIPSGPIAEKALSGPSAFRNVEGFRDGRNGDGKESIAGIAKDGFEAAASTASGEITFREAARAVKALVRQAKNKPASEPFPAKSAQANHPDIREPTGPLPPWRAPDDLSPGHAGDMPENSDSRPTENGSSRAAEACETCSIRTLLN